MRKTTVFLLALLVTTLGLASDQKVEVKIENITQDDFVERSHEIYKLGHQIPDHSEKVVLVVVSTRLDGWYVGQSEIYIITQNSHTAHPSILKDTTISDLESGRTWIKREIWTAANRGAVKAWLKK